MTVVYSIRYSPMLQTRRASTRITSRPWPSAQWSSIGLARWPPRICSSRFSRFQERSCTEAHWPYLCKSRRELFGGWCDSVPCYRHHGERSARLPHQPWPQWPPPRCSSKPTHTPISCLDFPVWMFFLCFSWLCDITCQKNTKHPKKKKTESG